MTVADVRVHGTTHERLIDRFARETLTPLMARAAYHYTAVRRRIVAADALVAIAESRYSVPGRYVGENVEVRETPTHYTISAGPALPSTRRPAGTSSSWSPRITAACCVPGRGRGAPPAPRWDPPYEGLGAVLVSDLRVYDAPVTTGGQLARRRSRARWALDAPADSLAQPVLGELIQMRSAAEGAIPLEEMPPGIGDHPRVFAFRALQSGLSSRK